eukprot:ANDGO_03558.mRNA.1 hypothetical protein
MGSSVSSPVVSRSTHNSSNISCSNGLLPSSLGSESARMFESPKLAAFQKPPSLDNVDVFDPRSPALYRTPIRRFMYSPGERSVAVHSPFQLRKLLDPRSPGLDRSDFVEEFIQEREKAILAEQLCKERERECHQAADELLRNSTDMTTNVESNSSSSTSFSGAGAGAGAGAVDSDGDGDGDLQAKSSKLENVVLESLICESECEIANVLAQSTRHLNQLVIPLEELNMRILPLGLSPHRAHKENAFPLSQMYAEVQSPSAMKNSALHGDGSSCCSFRSNVNNSGNTRNLGVRSRGVHSRVNSFASPLANRLAARSVQKTAVTVVAVDSDFAVASPVTPAKRQLQAFGTPRRVLGDISNSNCSTPVM